MIFVRCSVTEPLSITLTLDNLNIGNMGCVFPMAIIFILPHAEFGPNDYQEDAHHFIMKH